MLKPLESRTCCCIEGSLNLNGLGAAKAGPTSWRCSATSNDRTPLVQSSLPDTGRRARQRGRTLLETHSTSSLLLGEYSGRNLRARVYSLHGEAVPVAPAPTEVLGDPDVGRPVLSSIDQGFESQVVKKVVTRGLRGLGVCKWYFSSWWKVLLFKDLERTDVASMTMTVRILYDRGLESASRADSTSMSDGPWEPGPWSIERLDKPIYEFGKLVDSSTLEEFDC